MTSCNQLLHPVTRRGAFCEAKVRSVVKQVKVRVAFRGSGNGTALLSSEYVRMPPGREEAELRVGAAVQARHPDKQDYLDATVSASNNGPTDHLGCARYKKFGYANQNQDTTVLLYLNNIQNIVDMDYL